MTSQRPTRPGGPGGEGTGPDAGRVVLRPGNGRLLAGGWWLLVLLLSGDLLLRGSAGSVALGLPLLAFSAAAVHAMFWHPAVVVDADGVELVNVLRTVRLPWASVDDLDTRWALTVHAGGTTWTSWAAPSSGRRIRPVSRRETPWAEPEADAISGSRAPGSSAGEAAVLVGTRWQTWRERSARDAAVGAGQPRVGWNAPVVASLAVTTAVAAAAVLRALTG
ncbi:PH domain-containing protein [Jannaschia sp. R86511]|uniref:PH domain-containing protein n=1 Tax=Jannaschia sp. R86511 TaxID=3093853 RepID=UPI0036D38962